MYSQFSEHDVNDLLTAHCDVVLMFRQGDAYRIYGTDAVVASRCCGLTLQSAGGLMNHRKRPV